MTHLDRLVASLIIALLTVWTLREVEQNRLEKAQASPIVVSVTGAVSRPGVIQLAANSRAIHAIALCGGLTGRADTEAIELARPLIDGEHLSVPENHTEVPLRENRPEVPEQLAERFSRDSSTALSPNPSAAREPRPSNLGSAQRRPYQRSGPRATEPADDLPRQPRKSDTKTLPGEPININTASVEDLIALPGIGPKTAQRIVESRQTEHSGTFTSLEDLATIRGIKGKTLSRLRPYLKIEGS